MYVIEYTCLFQTASTSGSMGRPAKFTHSQLQAAALALVDREGLAGLSMRALANELGTGAMTLYNYVSQREDIDLLVVEAVIGEARWPLADYAQWQDEIRAIATALWQAVRAHPHAIPLILTRRSRSPAVFEVTEAMLRALARSAPGAPGHGVGGAHHRTIPGYAGRTLCALDRHCECSRKQHGGHRVPGEP
jgi:AcrR family transcriptional regulator